MHNNALGYVEIELPKRGPVAQGMEIILEHQSIFSRI
jgi:hypothetical protein